MENSFKTIVLLLAIVLTGLSAGLFYAWAVSVIPGTKRVPDQVYLQVMQEINRAILNPGFFTIFFGSIVVLLVSGYQQYQKGAYQSLWFIAAASVFYLIGTMGVTVFGNVPMNDSLDVIELNKLSLEKVKSIRVAYERRWNQLHMIRTVFSVLSFISITLTALFNESGVSKF